MNPKPINVLIVEDSITQVIHLQELLKEQGLEKVYIAEDGMSGLDMARKLRPDLIILDLQMPKMNGFQVVQALKESRTTNKIPVIMFSSHSERETQVLGVQLGAVEFIPKDAFADAVLLETLRQMGFLSQVDNVSAD